VKPREFFESLEARADLSKVEGIDHAYLFDIDGEGQWLVEVRDGKVRVAEGSGSEPADVTISLSADTFEGLASRRQSPVVAYMKGKLKVKGDTAAAMKLQKLF
jgi:putative sterol carrier protein